MLSDADLERYARQVIMPNVGEDGQERLLASQILVVGAGGLGSPLDAPSPDATYTIDFGVHAVTQN